MEAARGGPVEVEVVALQILQRLAGGQGGLGQLGDPAGGERLGDLGVGAEGPRLLLQDQVGAHVRRGRDPDVLGVLGPQRLVVEVPRAVVAAVLQQVHQEEGVLHVAVAEDQVLVEPGAVLAVEVDVEELAVPERLRDAVREVEPGHLLVADLGVEADPLGVLQLVDERQRVADGRQQDVAARLVRLGLDGEPDVVALVDHIGGQQVHALLVTAERGPDVLGGPGLGALAAAPADVGGRAELGGQVDVAHHLPQGVAPHVAVVAGEAAVLEDRVGEQVRGGHRDLQTGLRQRLPETLDGLVPVRLDGQQVVVVEGDTVRTELGEAVDALDRVERARLASPNWSRACQPTVHSPKVKRSSGLGV